MRTDLTVPGVTRPSIRPLHLAALALVSLVVVSCGGDGGSGSAGVSLPAGSTWKSQSGSSVTVDAKDDFFVPQFIEVKKGTKVTFENTGRNRHNVLAATEGSFKDIQLEQFEPGMSASRTFDETGEFGYYCSLHGSKNRGMYGGIKVVG